MAKSKMKSEEEIRKKLKQVRTDRLHTISRFKSALEKKDDMFISDYADDLDSDNTMIKTLRWVLGFEKHLTNEDFFKELTEKSK